MLYKNKGLNMQNIDAQEIKELLTIIPRDYPSLDIFHLTSLSCGLCEELDALCKSQEYGYELVIPDTNYFELISKTTNFKPHKFDFNKNRYNRHAKQYDFVFVKIDLKEIEDFDIFCKKLHAVIKNAGKVIFILEEGHNLRELEDRLIKHNYVAVNEIENTFKNYQILGANKMHGWGN